VDSLNGPGEGGPLDATLDEILVGGREPATIRVVMYDSSWPDRFEVERRRLRSALGGRAGRIEHIGSTAVPGLAAKPIVDILVEMDEVEDESGYLGQLEAAGYQIRVREPRHRMFRTPARDVHVHLWPTGSAEVQRHLAFRDWLRAHPEDCQLYQRTKQALAARPWRDMNYYAEAKTPVIEEIMGRALSAGGGPSRRS
jgi:GrpB-like predicted nucleotidyltransferase (UPF0157 family)